jgi:hypothetical protein
MRLGARAIVAFDQSSVSGAVMAPGLGGPRLRALARVSLAPAALVPSPLEANVLRPEAVREALVRLREELGAARATLVLPDGIARIVLLEVPADAEPRAYARYRLAQSLSYPESEAVVDVLPLGRERCLGAAVRRAIVESYESVAGEGGFVQERVQLAPLAALGGLLRGPRRAGPAVEVILGDAALSIAACDGGVLRLFRNRRRDPGPDEADRILDEAERTAAAAWNGTAATARVVVTGAGARAIVDELASRGRVAELGATLPGAEGLAPAAEAAWLGAARS